MKAYAGFRRKYNSPQGLIEKSEKAKPISSTSNLKITMRPELTTPFRSIGVSQERVCQKSLGREG
jgi:hypothetical protein